MTENSLKELNENNSRIMNDDEEDEGESSDSDNSSTNSSLNCYFVEDQLKTKEKPFQSVLFFRRLHENQQFFVSCYHDENNIRFWSLDENTSRIKIEKTIKLNSSVTCLIKYSEESFVVGKGSSVAIFSLDSNTPESEFASTEGKYSVVNLLKLGSNKILCLMNWPENYRIRLIDPTNKTESIIEVVSLSGYRRGNRFPILVSKLVSSKIDPDRFFTARIFSQENRDVAMYNTNGPNVREDKYLVMTFKIPRSLGFKKSDQIGAIETYLKYQNVANISLDDQEEEGEGSTHLTEFLIAATKSGRIYIFSTKKSKFDQEKEEPVLGFIFKVMKVVEMMETSKEDSGVFCFSSLHSISSEIMLSGDYSGRLHWFHMQKNEKLSHLGYSRFTPLKSNTKMCQTSAIEQILLLENNFFAGEDHESSTIIDDSKSYVRVLTVSNRFSHPHQLCIHRSNFRPSGALKERIVGKCVVFRDLVRKKMDSDFEDFIQRNCVDSLFDGETATNQRSRSDFLNIKQTMSDVYYEDFIRDLNKEEVQDFSSLLRRNLDESVMIFNFSELDFTKRVRYASEEDNEHKKNPFLYFGQTLLYKSPKGMEENKEENNNNIMLVPHGYGIIMKRRKTSSSFLGFGGATEVNYSPIYIGHFKYGLFEGDNGCLFDPKQYYMVYEGHFLEGQRSGKGIQYSTTGDKSVETVPIYHGLWLKDVRHGKGESYDLKTGIAVRGTWEYGEIDEYGNKEEFECPLIPYKSIQNHLNDSAVEGKGAIGIVYRIDSHLIPEIKEFIFQNNNRKKNKRESHVAVKIMNAQSRSRRDKLFHMTKRGICLCNRVSSDHILKIYGIIKGLKCVGYVMEYCNNSMDKIIDINSEDQIGFLTLERKIDILKQLARGMRDIHEHDVMHRDLKWGNVMVNNEGVIKITDLDTMKADDHGWKLGSIVGVQQTSNIGTSGFLSPEVFFGKKYSTKCDVFAYGMMIYTLIRGENHPFKSSVGHKCKCGISINSILESRNLDYHVANHDLKPLISSEFWDDDDAKLPKFLKLMMTHCWDNNPLNRPNFEEILEIFELEERREKCFASIHLRYEDSRLTVRSEEILLCQPKIQKIKDRVEKRIKKYGLELKNIHHCGRLIRSDDDVFKLIRSEDTPTLDIESCGNFVHLVVIKNKKEGEEIILKKNEQTFIKKDLDNIIIERKNMLIEMLENEIQKLKKKNQSMEKKIQDLQLDKVFIKKTMKGTIRRLKGQYNKTIQLVKQENNTSIREKEGEEEEEEEENLDHYIKKLKEDNEKYQQEFKIMEHDTNERLRNMKETHHQEIERLKTEKRTLQRENKEMREVYVDNAYVDSISDASSGEISLWPTIKPMEIERLRRQNKILEKLKKKEKHLKSSAAGGSEVKKLKREKEKLIRKNRQEKAKHKKLFARKENEKKKLKKEIERLREVIREKGEEDEKIIGKPLEKRKKYLEDSDDSDSDYEE